MNKTAIYTLLITAMLSSSAKAGNKGYDFYLQCDSINEALFDNSIINDSIISTYDAENERDTTNNADRE